MSEQRYTTRLVINADAHEVEAATQAQRRLREEMERVIETNHRVVDSGSGDRGARAGRQQLQPRGPDGRFVSHGDGSGGQQQAQPRGPDGRFVSQGGGGSDGGGQGRGGGGARGWWRRNRRRQIPVPSSAGAATLLSSAPFVGGLAAGALMDTLRIYNEIGGLETPAMISRALLPGMQAAGSGLLGFGAGLGYEPSAAQGTLNTITQAGLGRSVTLRGTRLAIALERGRGISTGATADFMRLFRAGGGAAGLLEGADGGDVVTARLASVLASGQAAGLRNADSERWLQVIARRVTELAEQGISVDPASAALLADVVGQTTGAMGMRRAGLAGQLGQTMGQASLGGGTPMQQFLLMRAAGIQDVGFFGATRALADPARQPEIIARALAAVRAMPGSLASKAHLLRTQFGLSPEEADRAARGGEVDLGGLPAAQPVDARGFQAEIERDAGAATTAYPRREASRKLKDITAGYQSQVPRNVGAFLNAVEALRRKGVGAIMGLGNAGASIFDAVTGGPAKAVEQLMKAPAQQGSPAGWDKGASLRIDLTPDARRLLHLLDQDGRVVFG